jgi:hypothetical protein
MVVVEYLRREEILPTLMTTYLASWYLTSPQLPSTLPLPITIVEIQEGQHAEADCQRCFEESTTVSSRFIMHSLAHKDILGGRSPIDGSIQIVVRISLRDRLLRLAHYPPIGAHPGGQRLYASFVVIITGPGWSQTSTKLLRNVSNAYKNAWPYDVRMAI